RLIHPLHETRVMFLDLGDQKVRAVRVVADNRQQRLVQANLVRPLPSVVRRQNFSILRGVFIRVIGQGFSALITLRRRAFTRDLCKRTGISWNSTAAEFTDRCAHTSSTSRMSMVTQLRNIGSYET